jgi:alanine racemase
MVQPGMRVRCAFSTPLLCLKRCHACDQWHSDRVSHYALPVGTVNSVQTLKVTSELIDIQDLEAGDSVGYGSNFTAPEPMRVGVVAAGYADGYPRNCKEGTPVCVIGGEADGGGGADVICPLVGRVSMDMLTIDLRTVLPLF